MTPPDPLVARLRAAGCVFAEDEAALLRAETDEPVRLDALVARRVAGEPLEQVLGWAEVAGTRVSLRPGVFVPRQRSALLVDEALSVLAPGATDVVVDLCCGSGALGLAVARARPGTTLHAADLDPVAVACARDNLVGTRSHVHEGDLLDALPDALRGRVGLLLVNAPYVPSDRVAELPPEARDHEPRLALDGGPDGVDVHRRVAATCGPWLAAGATVLVETSTGQADRTAAALAEAGLVTTVVRDADLGATAVRGTRP